MHSLPPNPYIPASPARDPNKFFGREEQLSWVRTRLQQHTLLVVHGAPRAGVSSLLLQACQRLSDLYHTTYMLVEAQSPSAIMQTVTRIASEAGSIATANASETLRPAFPDWSSNGQRKPVLLALDGLAAYDPRAKVDLVNSLAMLASTTPVLHVLLGWGPLADYTLTRDMPLRISGVNANLPPVAQLKLGPLPRVNATELITQTAKGLLKYDYGALERILQEANGRPHALQSIGFACYERRALLGRVSARDVQAAVDDAVTRLTPLMNAQWEHFTREQQLLLASSGTVRGEHGLLSLSPLINQLASNDITLGMEEAREALIPLEQLDVFEPAGTQSFRFSSGLLRAWTSQYASLPAVTGKPLRSALLSSVDLTAERRQRIARAVGWTALLLFIVFLALGGPSLVTGGGGNAPAAIPTVIGTLTTTRVPGVVVPTVNSAPSIALAYMFRKSEKEKWRIYVAGQDGANPIGLTNAQGDDQWPSWSPDGTKIAFGSNRDGNWEIYAMSADGSEPARLTRNNANDWSPSWSPDGTKIVFASARDRNFEIYVMNADGSSPVRLTNDPADDHAPVWSPDGRVIAFASKRTGSYEIYLMNPDGSAVTRLTRTNANNFSPTWSPDSRRLAFESFRDGNWEIYAMDGDGNNVKNLTNSPSGDQAPAWSPDGQWIAFQSNRGGVSDVWALHPDGSGAINWTRGAGIAQSPAWRPLQK